MYSEYQSDKIIVNGVTMSVKEYNKIIRAKKKAKRKKKELNEIRLLPTDIKALMRNVKVFKSLVAFYDNGYKQWGKIHREVLAIDDMGVKFAIAKLNINEMNAIIEEICKIAKKGEKSVYQYIMKLSYKMYNVQTALMSLYDIVKGTQIINSPYANHEIINGNGRRLGLRVLMYKTEDAICEINNIISNLQSMAEIPNSVYDNSKIMKFGTAI